jgi:hypothetical protein
MRLTAMPGNIHTRLRKALRFMVGEFEGSGLLAEGEEPGSNLLRVV